MTPPPVLQPRRPLIWPAIVAALVIGYCVVRTPALFSNTVVSDNNSNAVLANGTVVTVHDTHVTVTVNGVTTTSGGNMITGSGKAQTEVRNVTGFTAIEVSDSAEVEATVGPTTSVTVTTDDNLLAAIETKLDGATLRIQSNQSYSTKLGVKVTITAPSLVAVKLTGSGSAKIGGLANTKFYADVTGSGSASLTGTANEVDLHLVGSGGVNARSLTAKSAQVTVTGSGSASVYATDSLGITVTGSGSVTYFGHPTSVAKAVTGSGSIHAQ